jgi:hAT family C-terminal dimerisation region/Domain of unknown function (DUF4413)
MCLGIQTNRSLCIDVKTRWNSTHRMLESSLHYKSVFSNYSLRDPNFEWQPTDGEWARALKVCKLLEVFLDATNLFSGIMYPTTNLFLVEVYKVKKVISEAYLSDDIFFLKTMSIPMWEKFEKYWGEIGIVMSIASILDPRFKLMSVDFTFKRMYSAEEVGSRIEEVTKTLKSLYDKYSKDHRAKPSRAAVGSITFAAPAVRAKRDDDFYAFLRSMDVENPSKLDLEVYLGESRYVIEDDDVSFDVLKWWSQNYSKFPILSKLARDVLCIPITTVASESTFSAGGQVLDDYRSSLKKDMIEILICGGDWIKAASKATIQTLEVNELVHFFYYLILLNAILMIVFFPAIRKRRGGLGHSNSNE